MRSRLAALLAVLTFAVLSCSQPESTPTPSDELPPEDTSTSNSIQMATTTTASPTTTLTEDSDAWVEVVIEDGRPAAGPLLIDAPLGREVRILLVSDADHQVHIHGYDLFYEVTSDEHVEVTFIADVPGIFEIELEGSHVVIAELAVS